MRRTTLHILILLCLPLYVYAQGTVSGYVKDQKTGEPLIGVSVTLQDTTIGASTNINGYYKIKNIPPQTYNLEASYIGYQTAVRYNIVVKSGTSVNVDFELQEQTEQLEEVTIQSSPFEKTPESPNSIQQLSRQEITSYPGGNNDVAKVVQSLPGVSGASGFRNDVIIRGGAPNENVYYLDGIEIPNINHFATQGSAGGPVGMLNVSFIEDVTLHSSAFPARYNNTLSGVLSFDQRNGNQEELQTNLRLSASEFAATVDGPLAQDSSGQASTTFIASVRRSYLQFLFKLLELPFLPDYWDYQYKINHKIDQNNELNLIGLGSIDNFRINKPENASLEQQAILDNIPVIKQWTTTTGISWKHLMNNGFWRATLSSNFLENDFRRYKQADRQDTLTFSNQSLENENNFRFELTQFPGDWTLETGLRIQHPRYRNETFRRLSDTTSLRYNTTLNFWTMGMFAQLSRRFLQEKLAASLGFRADGNTFTESGTNMFRTLSPRLSLSYELSPKWKVNASAGRYYKLPPYTMLGFKNQQRVFANKNTQYIESNHLVAGVEFLPRTSTRFTLEGFYKKYGQYPVSVSKGISLANLGSDFEVLGNENVQSTGEGRTYGVEFLARQKLSNNLYGILAYTLYRSEFSGTNGEFTPSKWDNRHLLTFTGGYKLPNNWELGLRLRVLGPAPYTPIDAQASRNNYFTQGIVKDYERLNSKRLQAYNATDIRIDKKWNYANWSLNLFFEVQNVFASNLPNEPSYTLKRNANNQVAQPRQLVRIDADNSSVVPVLGMVIDF